MAIEAPGAHHVPGNRHSRRRFLQALAVAGVAVGAGAVGAKLSGILDGDATSEAENGVNSTNVQENPTVAPPAIEHDRELMVPAIIEAPQKLKDQLKKEVDTNTEVLHYYQGEYLKFGFLIDNRLPQRTAATTDFKGAKHSTAGTLPLSDFKLTTEYVKQYQGEEMSAEEMIKRMENVFLLTVVNDYRASNDHKELFESFDPETDPHDLQALAKIKDLIRTNKLKGEMVDGFYKDPTKDRFIKMENDNPGGVMTGGFGYGRTTMHEGEYEGSEVLRLWMQENNGKEKFIERVNGLVANGKVTRELGDKAINVGHEWTVTFARNVANMMVPLTYPDTAAIYGAGGLPDSTQTIARAEPFQYQLVPYPNENIGAVSILSFEN